MELLNNKNIFKKPVGISAIGLNTCLHINVYILMFIY